MLRLLIAVLCGASGAVVAVVAIDSLAQHWYPVATDIDWSDAEQVHKYLRALPAGALALEISAWIGGVAVGALVGSMIARRRSIAVSLTISTFVLFAAAADMLLTLHPLWMVLVCLVPVPIVGLLVGRAMAPRI